MAKSTNKRLHESRTRLLLKTVSYRLAIVVLNFIAVFVLTGNFQMVLEFTFASVIYLSIAYYLHERIWDRIRWVKTVAIGYFATASLYILMQVR